VTRTDLGTFHFVLDMVAASDGRVYFVVRDAAQQHSIWATDGTLAGTRRADNLPATTRHVQLGTAHRGKLFLSVEDPIVGVEPFVMPLAGSVERAGRGCARPGRLPVLDANIPRLGGSLALLGSRCAPSVLGVTVLGPVADRPLGIAGTDCALLVAADRGVLLFGTTTAAGTWLPPAVPIPNLPPLVGIEVAAQAGFDVRGVLEASNAVHVTIGP
jgi:ELWxxDGT repeat protein